MHLEVAAFEIVARQRASFAPTRIFFVSTIVPFTVSLTAILIERWGWTIPRTGW